MSVAFALDTSCVIPLLTSWHEFHVRTRQSYDARQAARERLIVPAHVLIESFAVLTRLPVRLSPSDASRLLYDNFVDTAEIAVLTGDTVWSSIQDLSDRDLGGGVVYDAIIAHAAFTRGASVLLTWNVKDFLRVAPPGLQITTP